MMRRQWRTRRDPQIWVVYAGGGPEQEPPMHVAAVTGTETEARGFLRAVARLAPHRFNLMELEVLVGTQGNAAQPLESGERRRVIVVHQDDEYLKVFESMDDALNCLEVWTRSGVEGVKVVEVVTNTWLIEAPGEYAAT